MPFSDWAITADHALRAVADAPSRAPASRSRAGRAARRRRRSSPGARSRPRRRRCRAPSGVIVSVERRAVAPDLDSGMRARRPRRAPRRADRSKERERLAVGREDHVAGAQAGVAGRRQRLDALHQRRQRERARSISIVSPSRSTRSCIGAGAGIAERGARRCPRSPSTGAPFDREQHVAGPQRLLDARAAARSRRWSGARSARPARARCRRRPTMVSRKLNDRPGEHRQHPPPDRGAVEARRRRSAARHAARAPSGRRGWRRRRRRGTCT